MTSLHLHIIVRHTNKLSSRPRPLEKAALGFSKNETALCGNTSLDVAL